MRGVDLLYASLQDLRHAIRGLVKHPGYAATAALTLALGIGFSTATFSVVHAVALRPLPFEAPHELVRILERNLPQFPMFSVSPGHYLFWRDHSTAFTGIGAWAARFVNVDAGSNPMRLRAERVSANLFPVLGVVPHVGRVFAPEDEAGEREFVAILSHAVWKDRFGGNPQIVGETIRIDRQPVTIVGVMGPDFRFPSRNTEIWLPLVLSAAERRSFGSHFMGAVGRLRPGVTIEDARRDMQEVTRRLIETNQASEGWEPLLFDLQTSLAGDLRQPLFLLLGAVSLVLLIACGNVANLLLVRNASRQRELAVRGSLGASRGRLLRQLFVEQFALAVVSGAAGLLLAGWLLRLMLALLPDALPSHATVRLDPAVLGFALLLVVVTPLIFGLVPAIQVSRADLRTLIASGGRQPAGAATAGRTRNALVVAEIALAMALLVGAGHVIQAFSRLVNQSPGFTTERAVLSSVSLPADAYPSSEARELFLERFLAGVQSLSDVEAAGISMPMAMVNDFNSGYEIEGQPVQDGQPPVTLFYAVSPGFLAAMRIPLLRGRFISEEDRRGGRRVAVISQALADKHFGGSDPLGRRIRVNQGDNAWRDIVGVVGNVKQEGLEEAPRAQVYEPYLQHPYFSSFSIVIRSRSAQPMSLVPSVRSALRDIDPDLPLADVQTLDELVDATVVPHRFSTALITTFGVAALALAAIGVYGVIAYTVGLRRHEFAIRVAHGAEPKDLFALAVRGALVLLAAGVAIGTGMAWLVRGALESLLFGMSTADPLSYIAVAAVLSAVTLTASAVPAIRATRVDPAEALRGE